MAFHSLEDEGIEANGSAAIVGECMLARMQVNGVELNVEDTGGSGPAIVFSHGLLWSTRMWRFQVGALRDRFRCIAYDHRGQGRSEVTSKGYDMETLAQDAAALIEKVGTTEGTTMPGELERSLPPWNGSQVPWRNRRRRDPRRSDRSFRPPRASVQLTLKVPRVDASRSWSPRRFNGPKDDSSSKPSTNATAMFLRQRGISISVASRCK